MIEHHKHLFHKPASPIKKPGAFAWIKRNFTTILLGGFSVIIILLGVFIIWIATLKVPSISSFADRKVSSSTKIYDRTGTVVLYDVHDNIRRTVVTSDQIAVNAKNAIVAIEDKNFYHNIGIEPKSILRALLADLLPWFKSGSQGGSTITQQLVKNTLLTQQKSITRKVKEWVLAVKLERVMNKDQILTEYLNEAPYGGQIYGIQEASESFFGVNASDLDLAESAYLAAIPNAPSYYSPYGKNRENLNARKNLVLKNMLDQGYINQDQYSQARAEVVNFKPQQDDNGKAIHFVEYVRSYLEQKYGSDMVTNGGLKVITTLDWDLQQVAEKTIYDNALQNEKDYNASNSALVAIDPKTGQILSMVGSRNYFDKQIDGAFNVATAGRQPGSSFKSIVYARAFEKGFEPETTLFDIPTQFGTDAQCTALNFSDTAPCYAPNDYDNKFLGPISARDALAQSRNIPAIQMLWMVGLNDALQTAKQLGITTLDRTGDRYGLTLVLGGGEVSLLDMTSVYGTFANDGVRNPATGILEVDDAQGNVLEKYTPAPQTVMDPNAVRKLSSVLSDNKARTPLYGANSFFYFGSRPVAGKTGTTSNNRDAWVLGYTPSVAVGVWTGNNDNTPMKKGSAISGPAWRTFMDAALQKLPYDHPGEVEQFPPPTPDPNYYTGAPVLRGQWAGGDSFFIDTVSGKLATTLTPNETKKELVIPNPHTILFWVDPSNPKGPSPADPTKNAQYGHWEAELQSWLSLHPDEIPPTPIKPTSDDDVHTIANQPQITLVGSETLSSNINDPVTIQTQIVGAYPISKIDYYLNDQYIGSSSTNTFTFIPSNTTAASGSNTIKIIATDSVYNKGELDTTLTIQ